MPLRPRLGLKTRGQLSDIMEKYQSAQGLKFVSRQQPPQSHFGADSENRDRQKLQEDGRDIRRMVCKVVTLSRRDIRFSPSERPTAVASIQIPPHVYNSDESMRVAINGGKGKLHSRPHN